MGCIFLAILGGIASQTDWMGGPGVLGPVSNWGTQFWASESVTVATPGQVSLIATQWNYGNWVKHVVESNSGISSVAQGFMPVDIDGDEIKDLIAHTNNEVVWYRNSGGYSFTKNVIGPASDGSGSCVYPCDLDEDGDIDVLVATQGVGAGWYENQSLSWVWHSLDGSTGYHRISAVDVEFDGDLDIIAVNNIGTVYSGDIYLFRNDGFQSFAKELAADLSTGDGWRSYPQDFNDDGYADLYATWYSTYIFLNDQAGNFVQSFHADYWSGEDVDGTWPSDLDMDGDVDLVVGTTHGNCFYAFLNDGTGMNFTFQLLNGTSTSVWYGDGAMALDIDLDGWPDIAGDGAKVGWLRQDPSNPLSFTLYPIDNLQFSHWLYAGPMNEKCIPSIDLFVTDQGVHIVYENRMLEGFASIGYLESSILELTTAAFQPCTLKYFAYNACVPNDTSLCFYWRSGLDSANIVNNTWNGPYYATMGMNVVDSFALSGTGRMFQYKAEFRGTPDDIAVLYEVWLTYNCPPVSVEEMDRHAGLPLQFANGRLVLFLPHEDWVGLAIYDIAGRLVKNVFNGYLCSGKHEFEVLQESGIYFAKLRYTEGSKTLKFIKLK